MLLKSSAHTIEASSGVPGQDKLTVSDQKPLIFSGSAHHRRRHAPREVRLLLGADETCKSTTGDS